LPSSLTPSFAFISLNPLSDRVKNSVIADDIFYRLSRPTPPSWYYATITIEHEYVLEELDTEGDDQSVLAQIQ
jgi:hypothetical protein